MLHGLYVVRTGGDFMHGRMLLPSLFAVLLPVAVVEVRGVVRWAAVAAVLPWAVICATQLRIDYVRNDDGIADERRFYAGAAGRPNPVSVEDYAPYLLYADGRYAHSLTQAGTPLLSWRTSAGHPEMYTAVPLRPDLPLHAAYITGNIGITGVRAGRAVHIIDPTGLADPFASRVRLAARGRPGHEKILGFAWLQARFADPRSVPDGAVQQYYGGTIQPEPEAVSAARHALRCGSLRDIDAAVTQPLTVGRFVRNIGLAVRLHSFRLDADPIAAEARLCRE
jgi:arabinofuranosyltransferase